MIGLAFACGIVTLIVCAVLAVGHWPWLYCAVHGHDPKCSIEHCGVIKFTCETCKREVSPD